MDEYFHPSRSRLPFHDHEKKRRFSRLLQHELDSKAQDASDTSDCQVVFEHREEMIETIGEIIDDRFVWNRLSHSCDEFIRDYLRQMNKKSCARTMSVLLNIL